MAKFADENNEGGIASASANPEDEALAKEAGLHGMELLRLNYTLSHAVHAYGAMCQAITELATTKKFAISAEEFHDLNRCLDVAIAGAVTSYQNIRDTQVSDEEVKHLGFLAHELRNGLATINMSMQLIKEGTVGFGGSTGQILDRGLKRLDDLIERSLTEVRLRVDPKVVLEPVNLLLVVDQIFVTAEAEARHRSQILECQVNSEVFILGDKQLVYSAISNLIQNALKYTPAGGKIQVRASAMDSNVVIEVEDECGGLKDKAINLFKAYEQQNENRSGLGLGLTIVQRAVKLCNGTIDVTNLPGKGCIFKIVLPQVTSKLVAPEKRKNADLEF